MTIEKLFGQILQGSVPEDAIVVCDGAEIVSAVYVPDLGAVICSTEQPTATTPHRVCQRAQGGDA